MKSVALALCLLPALATAQEASQRPMPRTANLTAPDDPLAALRPQPRPAGLTATAPTVAAASTWPRPQPRPENLAPAPQVTLVSAPKPQVQQKTKPSMTGAVCGRPEIKGQTLAPMRSTVKGCGIAQPVSVTSIAGVTFSPAPTIDCDEAVALSQWVSGALQPAFNGQVTKAEVADSYACRPRNNVRGNPVSVHGLGEAIDISGVVLKSGQQVIVTPRLDRRWQKARKDACGTFTVILGPGSDGYHENHIHFDVSQHGGGPYCR